MATGRKVTSYQLQRQLGAHLGHIPAAAMASRTIPVENLSSIKILFFVLANLAHGVLAQGTTAEPRIDYQNQVNRAISCFLLLSSPNSCRNLKKWGPSRPFFETAPLFRSSSSLECSVALVLFSSSPSSPSPYVLSSERDFALLDIVHLDAVLTVFKMVYFRLKSGVRKAELRGHSRQVRL